MSDDKDSFKDKIDKKLEDGVYVSKTWDIRVVENFFKKLFGKKKKKQEEEDGE
jgi:hypothetical protein